MKKKYDVLLDQDAGWDGYLNIDLYNDETKRTVKNKEEWMQAMKEDYILEILWTTYVLASNKE